MNKKMVAKFIGLVGAITAGLALGTPAAANDTVALEGDVKVERTVAENGVERTVLEEPTKVLPGDRLVFVTRYTNTGAEAVEDFVVTNPLPGAVVLAEPGDFDVSVDGGATFAALASLTVAAEDGSTRPAALDDVTHIRWTLARIAPGASGEFRYFARVR